MTQLGHDEILAEIQGSLKELFEIDPTLVVPSAHLGDDLGLDSIDAIDLAVRLQQVTGKKLSPQQFKSVRTVEDMVNAVEQLLTEPA